MFESEKTQKLEEKKRKKQETEHRNKETDWIAERKAYKEQISQMQKKI